MIWLTGLTPSITAGTVHGVHRAQMKTDHATKLPIFASFRFPVPWEKCIAGTLTGVCAEYSTATAMQTKSSSTSGASGRSRR